MQLVYLFDGVKCGAVAADAGSDDEQVVIEGFGRGAVVGKRGGYCAAGVCAAEGTVAVRWW